MSKFRPMKRNYFNKYQCGGATQTPHLWVYHGTQGPTAKGGAITLTTRKDGSAHQVHGRFRSYKIAPNNVTLCGVRDANTGAVHIEDATFASWIRKTWFLHKRQLMRSAYEIAKGLRQEGIPCHFIDLEEAEAAGSVTKLRGWTYHVILSLTTWCGSTHMDPAPGAGYGESSFPHRMFKQWVEYYYDHPRIHRPLKVGINGKIKER